MIYVRNDVEVITESIRKERVVAGTLVPYKGGESIGVTFDIPVELFFFELRDRKKFRAGIHLGINAYKAAESLHDFYERGEI